MTTAIRTTLPAVLVGLLGGFAPAVDPPSKKKSDADGKDDRAGVARWECKLLDKRGKSTRTGTFTGYANGEIRIGKKPEAVGRYTSGKNQIKATFTKGPLLGQVTMVLTERKPVKYEGDLVRADGTKSKIVCEIIND